MIVLVIRVIFEDRSTREKHLFIDAKEVDDPLVLGLVGGDQHKHHVALEVRCHLVYHRWDQ